MPPFTNPDNLFGIGLFLLGGSSQTPFPVPSPLQKYILTLLRFTDEKFHTCQILSDSSTRAGGGGSTWSTARETCHIDIADFPIPFPWRLQVMTHILLSSVREKVDHCRIVSFSVVFLYSRSERSTVFNAVTSVSAVNCLLVVLSVVYWDVTPTGESWSAETSAGKRKS